jgi:hypothetical protein
MERWIEDRLMVLADVHLVFVASALLLAFADKIGRSSGAHEGIRPPPFSSFPRKRESRATSEPCSPGFPLSRE